MVQGTKAIRLSKAAREFNVGISTIVEFLHKKGFDVDTNPNTKLPPEAYELLAVEYSSEISVKKESEKLSMRHFMETQEAEAEIQEEEPLPESAEEEVLIKDSSGAADLVDKIPETETIKEPVESPPAREEEKKPEKKKKPEEVAETPKKEEKPAPEVVEEVEDEKAIEKPAGKTPKEEKEVP